MSIPTITTIPCPCCTKPSTGHMIFSCASCCHRWQPTTHEEQTIIEESEYGISYAGYKRDEIFARNVRHTLKHEISHHIRPGSSLLDVGCGAGEFITAATEVGFSCKGIDVSQSAVSICLSKGLDAECGNFLSTNYADKFDGIFFWDVIEHLQDPHSFIVKARESLTPGGIIVVKTPSWGALSVKLAMNIPKLSGSLLGAGHIQYYTKSSISSLLMRAGLDVTFLKSRHFRGTVGQRSIRKFISRTAKTIIKSISRDDTLYLIARK